MNTLISIAYPVIADTSPTYTSASTFAVATASQSNSAVTYKYSIKFLLNQNILKFYSSQTRRTPYK